MSNLFRQAFYSESTKKLIRRYLALAQRERFCKPLKRQQNRFRTTVLPAARCLVSILYYFRYSLFKGEANNGCICFSI